VELYFHYPNTSSWRDTWLIKGKTLPLLYLTGIIGGNGKSKKQRAGRKMPRSKLHAKRVIFGWGMEVKQDASSPALERGQLSVTLSGRLYHQVKSPREPQARRLRQAVPESLSLSTASGPRVAVSNGTREFLSNPTRWSENQYFHMPHCFYPGRTETIIKPSLFSVCCVGRAVYFKTMKVVTSIPDMGYALNSHHV
jgi:hypothetical protein